jgi:hypothetical protein
MEWEMILVMFDGEFEIKLYYTSKHAWLDMVGVYVTFDYLLSEGWEVIGEL